MSSPTHVLNPDQHDDVIDRMAGRFTVGDGCWEWNAARNHYGYGVLRVDGNARMAHRLMFQIMVGPIPPDHDLDHLCRNRACIRPDHLEAVTHRVNMSRGENATKTHCPHGHKYTEVNTRRDKYGYRYCRACAHAYNKKRWADYREGLRDRF